MNKICTSIEQSKKLIELGIDVKTADMYWWTYGLRYYRAAMDDGDFNKESDIPAWSLTSLLGLMPDRLYINDDEVYWFELDNVGGLYRCYYEDEEDYDLSFFDGEEPIDVLFNMVVWLKENNKI